MGAFLWATRARALGGRPRRRLTGAGSGASSAPPSSKVVSRPGLPAAAALFGGLASVVGRLLGEFGPLPRGLRALLGELGPGSAVFGTP